MKIQFEGQPQPEKEEPQNLTTNDYLNEVQDLWNSFMSATSTLRTHEDSPKPDTVLSMSPSKYIEYLQNVNASLGDLGDAISDDWVKTHDCMRELNHLNDLIQGYLSLLQTLGKDNQIDKNVVVIMFGELAKQSLKITTALKGQALQS